MTQLCMFDISDDDDKYSKKIQAPIYEPRGPKPDLMILCDDSKTRSLITKINESKLNQSEKDFLKLAAYRHSVFHYENIADYYSHASVEMQKLMEDSALVIIDFNAAIENGFIKLCEEMKEQFLEDQHYAK